MKNNNCYYRFLLFVIVCFMSVNLHAQSDNLLQNFDLKRHKFRLAIDVPNNDAGVMPLKKEQLQTVLSYEQFRSYKVARNCYIASIPFLSLGAGFTALVFVSGMIENYFLAVISGCAVAYICLPVGIPLIVHSKVRLNRIAKNYNNQRHSSYFQNGLQLNYGFVGNGIGVNLKF